MSCFDTFCPLTSRPARTTPFAPWLSVVLQENRSKLRAAERVWRKSQNPTDLHFYRSLLSDFSANVSTAKRTYYHDKINNSPNSRMLFKTFSSLFCPPPPSTLTADDFGTFFINKITNLTAQFSTPQSVKHILPANINSFTYFSPLSEAEIPKLILSSHPTTCPLDPIPSNLFQAISPAVVPALTHIANTSLHTGIFPSAFKQAHITPLLKKPTLNPTLLGNYRPVSLLPFIAKTLERVVFNQVTALLTQYNLLDSNQSGFRSGNSTKTALLSVVGNLRLARTSSKSSLLILLDLSAAFDMVNHQILLSTLLRKAISGTALQWFDSYLSDRSFKVSWRGEVSKSQHLANRGATGLSSWTTSLFCLHGFTRFCHFINMAFHITAMLMTLNSTSHSILMI